MSFCNVRCYWCDEKTGDCNCPELAHITPKCDENCRIYLGTLNWKGNDPFGNLLKIEDLNDSQMFYNRNLSKLLKEDDIKKIKVKIFEKIKIKRETEI